MDGLLCGKMPNGHLLWETVHYDRRRVRELTIEEHVALFGPRLTWKTLYRRGYRLVHVRLVEMRK